MELVGAEDCVVVAVQRLVVVEFDSVERAKQFYDSPEYRAAREARAGAADMNILVVEGLAGF